MAQATMTRRRISRRQALRALGTALIIGGVLAATEVVVTMVWQEPVTALVAYRAQTKLAGELDRAKDRVAGNPAAAARWRPSRGGALGRLRIKRLGLSKVIIEGTSDGNLRRGPGHAPATALPGQGDTVAIAGHRTTYGAPFRHLDKLRLGDRIEIDLPYGRAIYEVRRTRIVPASAGWAFRRQGVERLVLSACHPLFRATERLLIIADPIKVPRHA